MQIHPKLAAHSNLQPTISIEADFAMVERTWTCDLLRGARMLAYDDLTSFVIGIQASLLGMLTSAR